jgi:hypothetical protein
MNVDAYRTMHNSQPGYGAGLRHYEYIKLIIQHYKFKTALDYGCGKGRMADSLNTAGLVVCSKYDPAINSISTKPRSTFDFVINTDVLEHVPQDHLNEVISDFKVYSNTAVVIPHLGRATAVLPSGENAHCTILPPDKWSDILKRYYSFVQLHQHDSPNHALFVCSDDNLASPQLTEAINQLSQAKKISAPGSRLRRFSGTGKRTPRRTADREALPPASDMGKAIHSFIEAGQLPDASFLMAIIPGSPELPFFSRARDLPTHFTALEREFRGQPRLVHFHACIIVTIRRSQDLLNAIDSFNSLWSKYREALCEQLSLRWLISAADTLADHGSTPVQQSLGMMGVLFGNTVKLVETERYIEKHDPREIAPIQPTKGVMLFDGMSPFRCKSGDMLDNMNKRLDNICNLDTIGGSLFSEIIKRVRRGPTTFFRLNELRKRLRRSEINLNI